MNDNILVVDDEYDIADLIEVYLQNENYTIFKYYSAKEALACIETTELDLAILDIMMPEVNGFSLCQKIREKYTFPVIMLTAKDEETDKITGLTLGADDYITKPFRPLELVARVKAQLRRYKKYNSPKEGTDISPVLSYSGLEVNTKTHDCLVNKKPVSLTPTELGPVGKTTLMRMIADIMKPFLLAIWKSRGLAYQPALCAIFLIASDHSVGRSINEP